MSLSATTSTAHVIDNGSTSSVTFTPAANSLVVVFACGDAEDASLDEQLTVSSSGHTFSRVVQSNGGPGGVSEIWACPVTASASMTVNVTDNKGAVPKAIKVVWFTDSSGGIPRVGNATGDNTGVTSVSYTSIGANSWAWLVGMLAYDPSAVTGETMQDAINASDGFDGGDRMAVYSLNALSSSAHQSMTIQSSPGTVDHLAAIEIMPAATVTSWVNRTVLSGSSVAQNGTTSHTVTFMPATSGNLLVAIVSGAVTFTTPTGWTLVQSAVGSTGLYVFSKTAAANESSFTSTHNGSNYPILGVVYEFPSTSVLVGTASSAANQSTSTAGPICTGLSGVYTRFATRSTNLSTTSDTANATWVVPQTEDYDANNTGTVMGVALSIAYDNDCTGPAFTPISGYTTSTGGGVQGISFAISSTDTRPTPLFLQGKPVSSGGSSAATVVATYDWPVTIGDLLVVALSYQSTTATATLSDTLGNTYQLATGPLNNATLGFRSYIFYAVSQSSGTNGVTATISASVTFRRILVHEYSSLDSFDGANGATGSSGAIDSGTVATKVPTELIFGWGISNNGTTTAGTGFTLRETAGSESTEDKTVATTGNYSASYPADGSAWLCQVATFYSSLTPLSAGTPLPWLHF